MGWPMMPRPIKPMDCAIRFLLRSSKIDEGARNGLPVGHRAAGGAVAIATIGARAQDDPPLPLDLLRRVEYECLIAAACSGPRHGTGDFAPNHQADRLPARRLRQPVEGRQVAPGHLLVVCVPLVSIDLRPESQLVGAGLRGFDCVSIREQAIIARIFEPRVPWLWSFLERAPGEVFSDAGGKLAREAVLLGDRIALLGGGLIGHGRA